MNARRLVLRDWEAEAWHAGRLSAVVRVFKSRHDWYENDGQPFYRDYVFAEHDPPDPARRHRQSRGPNQPRPVRD